MTNTGSSANIIIQLRTSRDILATIPRLLGYQPTNSVVILTTHYTDGTSTMRLNLPAPDSDDEANSVFAATLTDIASRIPDPQTSILAIYTNEPWTNRPPHAPFVDALTERLRLAGLTIADTLAHTPTGWGRYAPPAHKHSLTLLDAPANGDDTPRPRATLQELATIPPATNADRRRFATAIAQSNGRTLTSDIGLAPDPVTLTAQVLAADQPAAADLGRLLAVMTADVSHRDQVIATLAWGAEQGRMVDGTSMEPGTIALDSAGRGAARRPDPAHLRRAIDLMTRMTALAVHPHHRTVALTVLAWLHWSQGSGSIASLLLEHAEHYDPHYDLTAALASAVAGGALPNWLFKTPVAALPPSSDSGELDNAT